MCFHPSARAVAMQVYYSRAAAMAVLPRFTQLSEAGPARLVDELEHVLTEALHLLKQQSKLAPPKMLSNGSVDGDSVPSADAPAAAAHVLDTILEKGTIASSDYLARAWTLAERMSRCGHRERLCEWLSLETWMGMVLDVLLKAGEQHVVRQPRCPSIAMLQRPSHHEVVV